MEKDMRRETLEEFPYPIAIYFKKVMNDERLYKRKKVTEFNMFKSLLDLFEMINRFIATTAISQYMKNGAENKELNNKLRQKFQKKLSLGDWQELMRETIKVLNQVDNGPSSLQYELFSFYLEKKGKKLIQREVVQLFNEIITVRNQYYGHSPTLTPLEYKRLYEENMPKVMKILSHLSFLKYYVIVSPIEVKDGMVKEYFLMKGTHVTECFQEMKIGEDASEGDLFLVNSRTSTTCLKLSPLTFFDIDYETDMEQYLWMYEGNKINNTLVKSLTYLGFTPTPKNRIETFGHDQEDRQELLQQFLQVFSAFFKEELAKEIKRTKEEYSPEEYYFTSQKSLIAYYHKTFFGREIEMENLNKFKENQDSGYYLIKGVPGQGKTSLMASIVARNNYVHHFISEKEGRNNELAMMKSLYVQIAQKIGKSIPFVPEYAEDLKRVFHNLLLSYSDYNVTHEIKEFIVIDGLDELEDQTSQVKLSFLPEFLPPHVYVVLSSRPVSRLNELEEKMNKCVNLRELSFQEVEKIVAFKYPKVHLDDIRELYSNCDGNPLLLKFLLDQYEKKGKITEDKISVEAFFKSFLTKVRDDSNPLSLQIIGLLTISKDGLSVYEISKITKQPKFKVVQAINQVSEYLICSERKYYLFHKQLIDFLKDEVQELSFDEEELLHFHKDIISFCELNNSHQYSTKNVLFHYYEVGDLKKILACTNALQYQLSIRDFFRYILLYNDKPFKMKLIIELIKQQNDSAVQLLSVMEELIEEGHYQIVQQILNKVEDECERPNSLIEFKVDRIKALVFRKIGKVNLSIETSKKYVGNVDQDIPHFEIMKLHLDYGNSMRITGYQEEAILYYKKALKYCDSSRYIDDHLEILHHLGDMEYVKGNYQKAIKDLEQAIELAIREGMILYVGKLYRILGQVYNITDRFKEAVKIYRKSLEVFQRVNHPILLGKIYNNISESLVYVDLEESEKYNSSSLAINERLGAKLELGKSQMIKGMLLRERGIYGEAIDWLKNSIETFAEVGYKSGRGKSMHQLAITYLKSGDLSGATSASEKSNEIFLSYTTSGYQVFIIKNYFVQSLVYREMGEAEKANQLLKDIPMYVSDENIKLVNQRFMSNLQSLLN